MEEIRVEVTLSRAEYVRGVRVYLRKSGIINSLGLVILALTIPVIGFLIWLNGMTVLNTALVVLWVMAVGMGVFLYVIQPGRSFDKTPQMGERVVYTFAPEHIGVRSGSVAGAVKWEFLRLWNTREFYVLFQEKGQYTIFPKRFFGGETAQEMFEDMVRTAVPGIQYKEYR